MNAIDELVGHVLATDYSSLPQEVVEASISVVRDTIGVGICGSRDPWVDELKRAAAGWGEGRQARVWATGEWMPAGTAALINAYQTHNQEYDCVHERAIVHSPAAILPSLLAYAERDGGCSGKDLITALVVGVDVASFIGMAHDAPMRYYRPAMCGALGAVAALGKLAKLDRRRLQNALGITYSQLSGTMQAHAEGSPALALQVGFNARGAMAACDLAAQGFPGPHDILEGRFGYFALYDGNAGWATGSADLGRVYQITRLTHKPFPTGRATHGGIDGVLILKSKHGFATEEVAHVRVSASRMIVNLVGRPVVPKMEAGYARLCMRYGVATALLTGTVGIDDFTLERLNDPARLELGGRVELVIDESIEASALLPQRVQITLKSGATFDVELPTVLGHPDRPLAEAALVEKFEACCRSARVPLEGDQVARLNAACISLAASSDVRGIVELAVA